MNKHRVITSQHRTGNRGSLQNYTIGFTLSIVLTLAAYILVRYRPDALSYGFLVFSVVGLAIAQLFVQLQFFIHLGHESKPRWNKLVFIFMLLVLLIIVVGSLWIMSNLHYNVMSPHETETYIQEEEGIKR
jgi:cytochrome o ubiquinol oxidase operon protein cyoD